MHNFIKFGVSIISVSVSLFFIYKKYIIKNEKKDHETQTKDHEIQTKDAETQTYIHVVDDNDYVKVLPAADTDAADTNVADTDAADKEEIMLPPKRTFSSYFFPAL
jgi:hypothetical protein